MVGETSDSHPDAAVQYIYTENSYEPLARVDSHGEHAEIFWYHTELNGLPDSVTDSNGDTVWRGASTAWGRSLRESTPVEWDTPQNLRFQGQYLDRETGLHYNTFRYYDRATSFPDGRELKSLPYGTGHLLEMRLSLSSNTLPVTGYQRDRLHRETHRTMGALELETHYDMAGRITSAATAGTAPIRESADTHRRRARHAGREVQPVPVVYDAAGPGVAQPAAAPGRTGTYAVRMVRSADGRRNQR
ncbi:Hypothetical protein ABZS17D1_00223 [Kosakonia cowanii]